MIIRKLSSFVFLFLCSGFVKGQGLEKVIVEKYYFSDVKDSSLLGGNLPAGSVTYRIFLDMLPGYRFQAAFGIPGHELRLATTTSFFNNENFGGTVPNVIPDRKLGDYTVMLDSWLSVGGASEGTIGILKTLDDTVETVINSRGCLQNTNPAAGIPLKTRDGLVNGTPVKVTGYGVDSIIDVFNKQSAGSLFSTTNGSWAAMGGVIGPDSLDNKVLIAQVTTNGIFSFELNIQIGTPYKGVEQYVAKNPKGSEIPLASLTYTSVKVNETTKGTSRKNDKK